MNERTLNNALNALYLAVLVLAAVVFYAVAACLVISMLGAAYFLCAGYTVRGKMVEVLVIAGFIAYLVVRGYLLRTPPKPLGLKASPQRFPRLFAVLDEVALNVGTRRPDEVYVSPGTPIAVYETAGLLGLFGRSNRVLEIGVASLYALNMDELKAILAHEFAHFTSRDALFRRFIAWVLTALQSAVAQLRIGRFWRVSPFYHALHAYEFVFRYFASTFSRQREYYADRLASRCYGGNVLASGLVNFACVSALFEGPAYAGLFRLALEGKMLRNLYAAFRAFSHVLSPDDLDRIRREVLRERSGLLDSHPCPARRIARVRDINRNPEPTGESARAVFEDPVAVEEELSRRVAGSMMGGLGLLDSLSSPLKNPVVTRSSEIDAGEARVPR